MYFNSKYIALKWKPEARKEKTSPFDGYFEVLASLIMRVSEAVVSTALSELCSLYSEAAVTLSPAEEKRNELW